MIREGRTVLCYKTSSVCRSTKTNTKTSVYQWENPYSVCTSLAWCVLCVVCCVCVCVCVCVCTITPTVLHTVLATTLHRLLHVLREWGPVVAFEGEPPASDSQRGAAGSGGGARLSSRLAPTLTFDPGKRLGRLAEDGAALQAVVISHRLATTRRLCGGETQGA